MNRTGLGLAVGAGYLLGRTKKLKLACAVGSMVAGRKLNLGPRAIAGLVDRQLKANPQLKGVGDQVRQDLRGVGKAASGAMVERQMNALADRLHGRTAQVRDELAGAAPGTGGKRAGSVSEGGHDEDRDRKGGADEYEYEDEGEYEGEYEDEYEDREGREAGEEPEGAEEPEEPEESEKPEERAESKEEPAAGAGPRRKPERWGPAEKSPAKKSQQKAPAKKRVSDRTVARKTAARKTAAAGNVIRDARSRRPKGGGDR
jgi:hypothetical protein